MNLPITRILPLCAAVITCVFSPAGTRAETPAHYDSAVLLLNQIVSCQAAGLFSWWEVGSSSNDHTMILSSINWDSAKPYPLDFANSNPALAGTFYYEVTVIDSSSSTHTADTRAVNFKLPRNLP